MPPRYVRYDLIKLTTTGRPYKQSFNHVGATIGCPLVLLVCSPHPSPISGRRGRRPLRQFIHCRGWRHLREPQASYFGLRTPLTSRFIGHILKLTTTGRPYKIIEQLYVITSTHCSALKGKSNILRTKETHRLAVRFLLLKMLVSWCSIF